MALAGCSNFVASGQAETDDGSASGSPSTGEATTGAGTDSASSGTSQGTATGTGGTSDLPDPTLPDPTAPDPTSADATGETTDSAGETEASTTGTPSETDGEDETGSAEDTGSAETTGPMVCMQADAEPNGNPAADELQELGEQSCSDDPSTVDGTIVDAGDFDVFTYFGNWNCISLNDPNHVVTVEGDVEVCLFPICPGANTSVTCLQGTEMTNNGNPGCCGSNIITANVNCQGTVNESATGFMLVSGLEDEPVCVDYTLTYDVVDA